MLFYKIPCFQGLDFEQMKFHAIQGFPCPVRTLRHTQPGVQLMVGKGQRVGVTRGNLSDSVGNLINIRRLTLQSQFCFDKTFIGGQDATIVITYTD